MQYLLLCRDEPTGGNPVIQHESSVCELQPAGSNQSCLSVRVGDDFTPVVAFAAILPNTLEPRPGCYRLKRPHPQTHHHHVLYCYELQVVRPFQGMGLGSRMMAAINAHTRSLGLSRVVLSCFKQNQAAWAFYTRKLGYSVDFDDDEYGILSVVLAARPH